MKRIIIMLLMVVSFFACEEILEVENISNQQVVLLAPSNGVTLNTLSPIFSWEALEEADTYQVQIATPNFEEALQIVKDTMVIATSIQLILGSNRYQWRVRAKNSGYTTNYTTQSFTVEE